MSEISTAQTPFDNPECDIILRSADGVDFHVFKLVLSLVSDVFKYMFTLPQDATQSDVSFVPIIPVTDNSTTLESLLLLCYPAATPTFKTLEDAKAVLEAVRKYDMGTVIDHARDIVFAQFLETKPLELYALSCVFGWKQFAQKAAIQTLQINLKDLGQPSRSGLVGMKDMSASDYHKLLNYHHRCGVAAQAVGKSLTWLPPAFSKICMWNCGLEVRLAGSTCNMIKKIHVGKLGKVLITPWFDEYLVSSGKELYEKPCHLTLSMWRLPSYNRAISKAISCSYCRIHVVDHMEIFRAVYDSEVKSVLAKVSLLELIIDSKLA